MAMPAPKGNSSKENKRHRLTAEERQKWLAEWQKELKKIRSNKVEWQKELRDRQFLNQLA